MARHRLPGEIMSAEEQLFRLRLQLLENGTPITVVFPRTTGGTVDGPTGARVGGSRQLLSGVLYGFVQEEPARSVVRQFAEIQQGDLIVDCDPDATIDLFPGQIQSGVQPLDDVEEPRFILSGRVYVQKNVGGKLGQSWDAHFGGVRFDRTLLLTRGQ